LPTQNRVGSIQYNLNELYLIKRIVERYTAVKDLFINPRDIKKYAYKPETRNDHVKESEVKLNTTINAHGLQTVNKTQIYEKDVNDSII
jgi:hypothetical protein